MRSFSNVNNKVGKGRYMLMKHKIFPKKYVVVGIMIVIALFGILCSSVSDIT